jgi:hypothetical protein
MEKTAFLPWLELDFTEGSWPDLSSNPAAMPYLRENPHCVNLTFLTENPKVCDFLQMVPWGKADVHFDCPVKTKVVEELLGMSLDEVSSYEDAASFILQQPEWWNLSYICENRSPLIMQHLRDKLYGSELRWTLDWSKLSSNPAAMGILEPFYNWVDWSELSSNPAAICMLEQTPQCINWSNLSENPAAMHLLEANQDKIDWEMLSKNPNAMHLLEANPDKICWLFLSENPAAIHLLEQAYTNGQHDIDWEMLAWNPAIFTYPYAKMKAARAPLHKELIQRLF